MVIEGQVKFMIKIKNERLIELRNKQQLSQQDVATAVRTSQSMIARIEAGERCPRTPLKIRLAKFFNVTVEWLFYEQVDDQWLYENNSSPTGTG